MSTVWLLIPLVIVLFSINWYIALKWVQNDSLMWYGQAAPICMYLSVDEVQARTMRASLVISVVVSAASSVLLWFFLGASIVSSAWAALGALMLAFFAGLLICFALTGMLFFIAAVRIGFRRLLNIE